MAPASRIRLRRAYQRGVPLREVDRCCRCQWQAGRVQRSPALYLLRGYGSWPNDWRRGRWRLACLHTESNVGTSSLRCLCIHAERKEKVLGHLSPCMHYLRSPDELDAPRDGAVTRLLVSSTSFLCSYAIAGPRSNWFSGHCISVMKGPSHGS